MLFHKINYFSKRKRIGIKYQLEVNIISVFNAEGELAYQQEGLGVNSDETVKKITDEALKIN